jgi:hypothetical protein
MKFIKNGPDIPERLLQKHEEGQVVFFCGAGISRPLLPDFKGLAKTLYKRLQVTPDAVQQVALEAEQYDIAIGLLEQDHVGGRAEVRKEIANILLDYEDYPKSTLTHEALLTLGRCRDDKLRLVTTNFDRLFQDAAARKEIDINTFQAPLLPVPKKRWDGLVYLHGLIPQPFSESKLDCLVVSSGDFGLAYLTERWAARFISELFRQYVVCFIGYSINDPVMRYMMDALAADHQRGETNFETFAFGSYKKGERSESEKEWCAKNVTPILYKHTKSRVYLHKTLRSWADKYHAGVRGKEQIVVQEAIGNPLMVTKEDDFVGRVLWALSDKKSDLPAKRFAELEPVPSLDWLQPLSERRYGHNDLNIFQVVPKAEEDKELTFSLIHRPASYEHAPWMALVGTGRTSSRWDDIMFHIASWLLRHLDNPGLILWIANRGGQLHEEFERLINNRLIDIIKLEQDGNKDALANISSGAPRAIPRPLLRTLWRLLLSGHVRARYQRLSLHHWQKSFKQDGLTLSLRQDFRKLMTPCIELRKPFHFADETEHEKESEKLKEIVDWELKLRANHVHSALRHLHSSSQWQNALPSLLPDLNLLLQDALDLMYELGSIDEYNDRSFLHQPSISEHPQNRKFHGWTALIDLLRDAWIGLALRYRKQARRIAQQWQQANYPLFKRLAFFAAAQKNIVPPKQAIDWLLDDDNWWLWSIETKREVFRLLVAKAPKLKAHDLKRLETAILKGPPRSMFKEDIDDKRWKQIIDLGIWLRLAKMESAGATLGEQSRVKLEELSKQYHQWRLLKDERDEFPFWMGDGDELRKFVATPRRRRELVDWLRQHPGTDYWQEDDWRQRCRDEFPVTAYALCELACDNVWPVDRWRQGLQAWAEEKLSKQSWRYMAPVIVKAPPEVLDKLSHSLSWWLKEVAKSFIHHKNLFFDLCKYVLNIDHNEEFDAGDPVTQAINHPVGLVTNALLDWWYRDDLQDNHGLPNELLPIFSKLCNIQFTVYRHARLLLATHAIPLLRVDPEWTKQNLIPLFDWGKNLYEAKHAWSGFLCSPRLYSPLFELIKTNFLETAKYYNEFDDHLGRQYATLLTFIALEPDKIFTNEELKSAIRDLPEEGRKESIFALVRALDGSSERRAEYWQSRILPFWKSIWPKSRIYKTKKISEPFARLCVATRENFPDALTEFTDWIQPLEHPDYVTHILNQEKLAKQYPQETLNFISWIIGDYKQWPPSDLKNILDDIKAGKPELEEDQMFVVLTDYLRKFAIQ